MNPQWWVFIGAFLLMPLLALVLRRDMRRANERRLERERVRRMKESFPDWSALVEVIAHMQEAMAAVGKSATVVAARISEVLASETKPRD